MTGPRANIKNDTAALCQDRKQRGWGIAFANYTSDGPHSRKRLFLVASEIADQKSRVENRCLDVT